MEEHRPINMFSCMATGFCHQGKQWPHFDCKKANYFELLIYFQVLLWWLCKLWRQCYTMAVPWGQLLGDKFLDLSWQLLPIFISVHLEPDLITLLIYTGGILFQLCGLIFLPIVITAVSLLLKCQMFCVKGSCLFLEQLAKNFKSKSTQLIN